MDKEIAQLKDAINHCEEIALRQELTGCKECAEDHLQLAIWLRELIGYKTQNSEQEPCTDMISRSEAMKMFKYNYKGERIPDYDCDNFPVQIAIKTVKEMLRGLPPVTPAEKIGYWIYDDDCREHGHCSECGYGSIDIVDGKPHNYCQNCGIRMEMWNEVSD